MKSNRIAKRLKPRTWFRRAVVQGTILAGFAGAWTLAIETTQGQDFHKPVTTKAWKQSGPWRAIGITPKKIVQAPPASVLELQGSGSVQKASSEAVVAKLAESADETATTTGSAAAGSDTTAVVNAIATSQSREPSLVKVPSVKIDLPIPTVGPTSPSVPADLETSRSVGAKVRLSMSTLSDGASLSGTAGSSTTNSSNLKVTRSGDITAETPVKVNFNQERILALPALPSANSPYAESGIEIPVRIEAVAETVQSIIETQNPLADLPAVGIMPAPEMNLQMPADRPPMLEAPEAPTPEVQSPEVQTLEAQTPQVEAPEIPKPQLEAPDIQNSVANASDAKDIDAKDMDMPASRQPSAAVLAPTTKTFDSQTPTRISQSLPSLPATSTKTSGPVSAAPSIVPLPNIDATQEEIQAISDLARSTQPNSEGVLSQPGAPVLITTGPMIGTEPIEPNENVVLESQDIRALQVNGTISRLHVVDSSVCQVVCNGNRLFIVADQTGETMVEVNMGKLHKPVYVKVVVQRPWARSSSASVSLEQMQTIVSRLAPTAEVTVQPTEEGSLVVKGFAENNQQAKKVLEAIRKMVLVPVIDQLEIR